MDAIVCCFALTYSLVYSTPVYLNPQTVAAVLDDVDQDYALQGEYLGYRWTRSGWQRAGLQVVALGGGQFAAQYFRGGLPGAGAADVPATRFQGARQQHGLQLVGEHGDRIDVRMGEARWYDSDKAPPSTLKKIWRSSPTLGQIPPRNATVLFAENQPATELENAQLAEDGTLLAGAMTKLPVNDFYLHVEFRTPYMPYARGQARGNSGVYVQRRYEVQILDSFGLSGADNECGALYKQRAPLENMCFPPLAWQTYDIHFQAARWDGGQKIADARITVYQNGVAVHYRQPITGKTGAGREEGPEPLPILFQDHGDPVTFRNVWIVVGGQPAKTEPACEVVVRHCRPRWLRCCRLFRRRRCQ